MRILDVRPDHEDEDIDLGRAVVRSEIAHPARVVMIVRGRGSEVAQFADRAAGRADPFPYREVLWLQDPRVFPPGLEDALFEGEDEWCAVVLSLEDEPVVWLAPTAALWEIELAFLDAQAAGGARR